MDFSAPTPPLCSMGFFCASGGVQDLTTVSDLPLNLLNSNPFHFKIVDSLQNQSSLLCRLDVRSRQLRVEGPGPLSPTCSSLFPLLCPTGWGCGERRQVSPLVAPQCGGAPSLCRYFSRGGIACRSFSAVGLDLSSRTASVCLKPEGSRVLQELQPAPHPGLLLPP